MKLIFTRKIDIIRILSKMSTLHFCVFSWFTISLITEDLVQFSRSVVSDSLWPHESQDTRPPVHHHLPEFTQTHVHRVKMPSSHLILGHPLLLLPPIPPNIRIFSNESTLRMRWPKCWVSALASFLPKKSRGWSPSEWTGWISLQSKGLSRVFSNTTVQTHQFFGAQPSSQSNSHIHTWPQEKP